MRIIKRDQSIHVSKSSGIKVDYYLFDEYEIHFNTQPPHSTQDWHHHEKIWETLFVLSGELTAKWKENNQTYEQIVKAGDVVETMREPHTFLNNTSQNAQFIVIKQLLTGKNKREILKTDKVSDE